jgi:hypothetical protein
MPIPARTPTQIEANGGAAMDLAILQSANEKAVRE